MKAAPSAARHNNLCSFSLSCCSLLFFQLAGFAQPDTPQIRGPGPLISTAGSPKLSEFILPTEFEQNRGQAPGRLRTGTSDRGRHQGLLTPSESLPDFPNQCFAHSARSLTDLDRRRMR